MLSQTQPDGLIRSSVIIIDEVPVIGTVLGQLPQRLGEHITTTVENHFLDVSVGERLHTWQKKMQQRIWSWLPRYHGSYPAILDRNPEGKYDERRVDSQNRAGADIVLRAPTSVEAYVPDGFSIPPDGWLIAPHFSVDQRCDGQTAFFVKGIRWLETNHSNLKLALMQFTGRTDFVPLERYYHAA